MFNQHDPARCLANAIAFEERAATARTMAEMNKALAIAEEWFAKALDYEREELAKAA